MQAGILRHCCKTIWVFICISHNLIVTFDFVEGTFVTPNYLSVKKNKKKILWNGKYFLILHPTKPVPTFWGVIKISLTYMKNWVNNILE